MNTCDRKSWVEGAWIFVFGISLLASTSFGLLKGRKLYYFLPNERRHAT